MRILYNPDSMALAVSKLRAASQQLDAAILDLQRSVNQLDDMSAGSGKLRQLAESLRTRMHRARALRESIEERASGLGSAIELMDSAEREILTLTLAASEEVAGVESGKDSEESTWTASRDGGQMSAAAVLRTRFSHIIQVSMPSAQTRIQLPDWLQSIKL